MTNPIHSQGDPEISILTMADGLGILSLVIVLLSVSFLHSRHTMFSSDEIMTLFVLNQPNFHSLLETWRAGIDSSGIWFYVLGRPWLAMFGVSEMSLRLYSASGIAAAAAIVWIAARRYYSFLPVAAAVTFVFASTHVLRWQLAYGRTYGVFLLAASLVLYLIIRGEEIDRPSPAFLIATFAAYTFLMGSHILGILYVGTFLGLQLILDYRSRRFRPWLYVCASASVFVFLFSLQNLRTTAALGKPSFWSVKPSVKDLLTLTGAIDHRVTGVLVFVALLLLLNIKRIKLRPRRALVYLLTVLFVALDLFFFAYSHVTTSIYVDRYMLPFNLVGVLILCELLTQFREAEAPLPSLRYGLPFVFLALAVAGFFVPRLQRPWFPLPNYTQNLADTLPPALPVVDTDVATFVEMEFYRHDAMHRRWMYPVDWPVALDPESTGGASGPHELDNLKAAGFYPSDIIPTGGVLNGQHDFIVLSASPDVWLKRRILADPHYTARKLGSYPMTLIAPIDIWVVHAGS
jgi:hypothetical protein